MADRIEDGEPPRFSVLLGPMAEWYVYDNPGEGALYERVFADTMKQILMDEPGEYEHLPWQWSEVATMYLERN